MKKITLNSLVFLMGVPQLKVCEFFPDHEFVDLNTVSQGLIGSQIRPDLMPLFNTELHQLIHTKLALGQRVVVSEPHMTTADQLMLSRIVSDNGHNVFYLYDDLRNQRNSTPLYNFVEVMDLHDAKPQVVQTLPDNNFFANIKKLGYSGITVIADVHGMMHPFRNAISWAKSRNHFILILGDLIDYGKDTLEVMDEAYHLVVCGDAEILIGNHEKKIFKYLSQLQKTGSANIKLSEGNRVTVEKINNLNFFYGNRWTHRFISLVNMMRNHRVSDNFIFAHAAVLPEMWNVAHNRIPAYLEEVTLFGQMGSTFRNSAGAVNRLYDWVELLKSNQIAIVGHDIRSDFKPLEQINSQGGKAIFLDTGCGKGGHLSTLDIRFSDHGARIENFNIH